MRWIRNHKLISFLILIIVACIIVVVSSVATMGSSNPVSKAVNSVCTTILRPVNYVADGITDRFSKLVKYKEISDENDRLKEENEQLKEELAKATLTAHELSELKNLSKVLNYKGIGGSDDMVSGDIISMSESNWMNNFTINVGSVDKVKEGDIVVNGRGLVGTVYSVGKNWAKVKSLADESSKVSFKLSGNMELIGILDSFSDGEMEGFMLDSNARVEEGDKIITSGMGVYPTGLEIGKITKIRYDSDSQLERVTVKPTVDFTSLQKVTVII